MCQKVVFLIAQRRPVLNEDALTWRDSTHLLKNMQPFLASTEKYISETD